MKKVSFLTIVTFLIGLLFGALLSFYQINRQITDLFKIKSIRAGQNGLINPLLEYELPNNLYTKELKNFHEDVEKLISKQTQDGQINDAAVYFRDLNNGPWFGINEDKKFFPSSLIKLPILIAYLKEAEIDPTLLKQELVFETNMGDFNELQYFKSDHPLEAGGKYTVDELLTKMIIYLDNNAKNLLVLNLNMNNFIETFTTLGIPIPNLTNSEEALSAIDYARFFRILYNASYLNKEMSKKALTLLTEADFKEGLVAGIPPDMRVAHKFGEHSTENFKQLHDCGIIYYPNKPYLLCIMTRGDNFDTLKTVIKDISHLVYNEVNQQITSNLK